MIFVIIMIILEILGLAIYSFIRYTHNEEFFTPPPKNNDEEVFDLFNWMMLLPLWQYCILAFFTGWLLTFGIIMGMIIDLIKNSR